jgi:hypothetical protein
MRGKTGGWFSVVLGVVLLIGGLVWGLAGSHQVSYENSSTTGTYDIQMGSSTGNVYVQAKGSDEYFVALSGDFSPAISQSDIDNSASISFVARTDTFDPNVEVNGTTIDSAHKIEKLVFYDKNGGVMSTYTTSEYTSNPNGVYASAWSESIWAIVAGVVLALAGIVQVTRKRNTSFSIGGAGAPPYQPVPPAYPGAQPGVAYPNVPPAQYPSANPYGQPAQQYPQNPYGRPAEQYPQNPNPYNNPYQRPPQG